MAKAFQSALARLVSVGIWSFRLMSMVCTVILYIPNTLPVTKILPNAEMKFKVHIKIAPKKVDKIQNKCSQRKGINKASCAHCGPAVILVGILTLVT